MKPQMLKILNILISTHPKTSVFSKRKYASSISKYHTHFCFDITYLAFTAVWLFLSMNRDFIDPRLKLFIMLYPTISPEHSSTVVCIYNLVHKHSEFS